MSKRTKSFKKTAKEDIAARLETTFVDLEHTLGKKKFKRNLKKATKALSADLKKLKLHREEKLKLPPPAPIPQPATE